MFVRSKKLKQWVPLSVIKGGTSANLLIKSMESEWGKVLYGKTLVQNIAEALYKVCRGAGRGWGILHGGHGACQVVDWACGGRRE